MADESPSPRRPGESLFAYMRRLIAEENARKAREAAQSINEGGE